MKYQDKIIILVCVIFIILIIATNYNIGFNENTIRHEETAEKMQKQAEDRIKAEKAFIKRNTTKKTFTNACNYYNGDKGVVQNYAKAEELFMTSAEMGAPFSPHYIVRILVDKFDKLEASDRTKDQIKHCYFWLLIAKCHSSLWGNRGDYYDGCYIGHMDGVFSYKGEFEKRLTPSEIQEVQDLASSWWEVHQTEITLCN